MRHKQRLVAVRKGLFFYVSNLFVMKILTYTTDSHLRLFINISHFLNFVLLLLRLNYLNFVIRYFVAIYLCAVVRLIVRSEVRPSRVSNNEYRMINFACVLRTNQRAAFNVGVG